MRVVLVVIAAAVTLLGPVLVLAQSAGKIPRVGYLLPASVQPRNEPFWEGLRGHGYVEGQNIVIERRYAEGKPERYPGLAAELVDLKVDVIVADGATAARAAKQATSATPVVIVAADPVASRLIASLNRPGGNVTGLSTNSPALIGKRLELIKETFPRLSRVAVMANVQNPVAPFFLKEAESAARSLGLQLHIAAARTVSELDEALAAMEAKGTEAILLIEDPTLIARQVKRITQLATRRRLPTIWGTDASPESGILMSYGPSYQAMFRRTAFYVDKLLKGAKPGELPVEEPTKFALVIDLRVANALGLTIPQSVLLRADQVLQ